MAKNPNNVRPKKPSFSATTEFSSSASYYKGEALWNMRRKLNGREFEISGMNRVEPPEGNPYWLLRVKELELPFKCNRLSGLSLAGEFGDDIESWPGNYVTIGVQQYRIENKTTYGAVINPVEDDENERDDEPDVPFAEDEDLE